MPRNIGHWSRVGPAPGIVAACHVWRQAARSSFSRNRSMTD